jgi:putative restriction endonuclease
MSAAMFTHGYIANSDPTGWRFFRERAPDGFVDEVNWWSPRATRALTRALVPGTPVFFRLTRPHGAIAGYGFFADFMPLRLDIAWDAFGWRNGARDLEHLLERVGNLRDESLVGRVTAALPEVGCHLLRDAHYWPESRWIRWGDAEGFSRNTVQGLTERDPARLALLAAAVAADGQHVPDDLGARFEPLDVDERKSRLVEAHARVGQGTFRMRLLNAYGRQCAITGEHTEPVLDAAHIQPYLGPRSNHPQNGLVLTKEFHALFDRGYVAVEPRDDEYIVRVSPRLRSDWNNGRRYYAFADKPLAVVPKERALRPSKEALALHLEHRFLKAG